MQANAEGERVKEMQTLTISQKMYIFNMYCQSVLYNQQNIIKGSNIQGVLFKNIKQLIFDNNMQ